MLIRQVWLEGSQRLPATQQVCWIWKSRCRDPPGRSQFTCALCGVCQVERRWLQRLQGFGLFHSFQSVGILGWQHFGAGQDQAPWKLYSGNSFSSNSCFSRWQTSVSGGGPHPFSWGNPWADGGWGPFSEVQGKVSKPASTCCCCRNCPPVWRAVWLYHQWGQDAFGSNALAGFGGNQGWWLPSEEDCGRTSGQKRFRIGFHANTNLATDWQQVSLCLNEQPEFQHNHGLTADFLVTVFFLPQAWGDRHDGKAPCWPPTWKFGSETRAMLLAHWGPLNSLGSALEHSRKLWFLATLYHFSQPASFHGYNGIGHTIPFIFPRVAKDFLLLHAEVRPLQTKRASCFVFREATWNLIVAEDTAIFPMCQYLRMLATQKGISAVELEDHKLAPMTQQVAGVGVLR